MSTSALPRELSGRIPELDGLRGVAIGIVVIFHYFQLTHATRHGSLLSYIQAPTRLGWTGVDLFFVLSGFLIGGILLDARSSTNYFQVFYKRRFFRIVPIYAAILLLFPLGISLTRWANHGDYTWLAAVPMPWFSYWTFTQNLWMAHRAQFGANSLAATWSLAVEEQFYLTLPLLVRLLPPRWLLRIILAGIFAAPLLRVAIYALWPQNWMAAYVLMPCRADALLLGVVAAILLRDQEWRERIRRLNLYWIIAFPVLLLGLAYLTWKAPLIYSPLTLTAGYTWIAFFYVNLLLYSLTKPSSVVSRALRINWLRWLGSIAYGTYLLHQMILGMLFGWIWSREPAITGGYTLLTTLAALALTLMIAKLSFSYYENPLIKLGHRSRYRFEGTEATEAVTPEARLVYP
jgi:peptidoglycan/LPS O-acetylase OafA/YrhL